MQEFYCKVNESGRDKKMPTRDNQKLTEEMTMLLLGGMNYENVAKLYGISRQAVQQRTKNVPEIRDSEVVPIRVASETITKIEDKAKRRGWTIARWIKYAIQLGLRSHKGG